MCLIDRTMHCQHCSGQMLFLLWQPVRLPQHRREHLDSNEEDKLHHVLPRGAARRGKQWKVCRQTCKRPTRGCSVSSSLHRTRMLRKGLITLADNVVQRAVCHAAWMPQGRVMASGVLRRNAAAVACIVHGKSHSMSRGRLRGCVRPRPCNGNGF